jgi:hypothetical protein
MNNDFFDESGLRYVEVPVASSELHIALHRCVIDQQ